MHNISSELIITVESYIYITSFKMKGSPDLGQADMPIKKPLPVAAHCVGCPAAGINSKFGNWTTVLSLYYTGEILLNVKLNAKKSYLVLSLCASPVEWWRFNTHVNLCQTWLKLTHIKGRDDLLIIWSVLDQSHWTNMNITLWGARRPNSMTVEHILIKQGQLVKSSFVCPLLKC